MRYSRAKICGLLRHANLKSHNVMPASFSCQRSSFRSQLPIGTSPLPAERVFSLEPKPREIKNPASSAGLLRPSQRPLNEPPTGQTCSMLEFVLPGVSNQLHLLGRPGPSGESPAKRGATDIRRVYQQSKFRQVIQIFSLGVSLCIALWISHPPVENRQLQCLPKRECGGFFEWVA